MSESNKEDVSQQVYELLLKYCQKVESSPKGWKICCPFHADSNPSCNVYFSGVFHCWTCSQSWPPMEGFSKLGVPEYILDDIWGKDHVTDVSKLPELKPLEDMEADIENKKQKKVYFTVKEREPWPEGWSFRGIPFLFFEEPFIKNLFQPTLVRLTIKNKKGKYVPERFPRLALKFKDDEHEIYLRLAKKQMPKSYNSPNLKLDNIDLIPLGLDSWKLDDKIKAIILVEGGYDMLKTMHNLHLMGKGWPEKIKVIALLGVDQWRAAFSKKFELRLLPQFKDKVLIPAFDNDKAGEKLTAEVLNTVVNKRLWLPPNKVQVLDYYPVHDPGDLEPELFKKAIRKIKLT